MPKTYIRPDYLRKVTALVGFCLGLFYFVMASRTYYFHDKHHVKTKPSNIHNVITKGFTAPSVNNIQYHPLIRNNGRQSRFANKISRHIKANVSNIHNTMTKGHTTPSVNNIQFDPLIRYHGYQSRFVNKISRHIKTNVSKIHNTTPEVNTENVVNNNDQFAPLNRDKYQHLTFQNDKVNLIERKSRRKQPALINNSLIKDNGQQSKFPNHISTHIKTNVSNIRHTTTKPNTLDAVNNDKLFPLNRDKYQHLTFQNNKMNLIERKSRRKQPALIREYTNPVFALLAQNGWQGVFLKEILDNNTVVNVIAQAQMRVEIQETSMQIEFPKNFKRPPNIDCAKLFDADSYHLIEVENTILNRRSPTPFLSEKDFQSSIQKCDKFIKNNGYIMDNVSKSEQDFPIAYSILVYKDISQVEHLLRAIYRPQNLYCIHVDQKSEQSFKAAAWALAACFDNVFISSKSLSVYWGHISLLDANLICLKDLWKRHQNATKKWKYVINLTGQEFPLKTNWEIVQILKANEGAVWVGATISDFWAKRWKSAFFNSFSDLSQPVTHILSTKGPPPYPYRMAKGPLQVALPYYFVDFVLNDKIAVSLRDWLSDTYIPDETFFSTLIYSGHLGVPGAYTGLFNNGFHDFDPLVRFKIWNYRHKCEGKVQRQLCILNIYHLQELKTRPELFANKFETEYHPVAYMCLEELHWNKTREEMFLFSRKMEPHFDTSAYQYLPWIKYSWKKNIGTTLRPNVKHTNVNSNMLPKT